MRDKSSLASDVQYEFFGDRDSHSDDKKIEKTTTLTECGAYRITNPTTEFVVECDRVTHSESKTVMMK